MPTIGLMRAEEAQVFDSHADFHRFGKDGDEFGSFEVFWFGRKVAGRWVNDEGETAQPGWYWWPCFPGCLPDGEPHGPFATSQAAHDDALDDA